MCLESLCFSRISKEHTSCPELGSRLDEGSEIMVLSAVAVVCGANNAQLRLIYLELGFSPKFPRHPTNIPATYVRDKQLNFSPSRCNTGAVIRSINAPWIFSEISSDDWPPHQPDATFLNFRNPLISFSKQFSISLRSVITQGTHCNQTASRYRSTIRINRGN